MSSGQLQAHLVALIQRLEVLKLMSPDMTAIVRRRIKIRFTRIYITKNIHIVSGI